MRIRFTARGAPGLRGMAVLAVTALALFDAASASVSMVGAITISSPHLITGIPHLGRA